MLSPEETFYQRLLANDPEEATQQAEEFAKEHSLTEFFDRVALPALAMAQTDSDRGALPPERRRAVTDGFRVMLENLSDTEIAEETSAEQQAERQQAQSAIICVAGRNELDETAALCLAHLLRQSRRGEVQALSADTLASDRTLSTG